MESLILFCEKTDPRRQVLKDVEIFLSHLAFCRRTISELPLLHSSVVGPAGGSDAKCLFFLSARPDHFVVSDIWSARDQERVKQGLRQFGGILQRLEDNSNDENKDSGDILPRYIFQLGRLLFPGQDPFLPYKLPFVAVLDVLDPLKGVWLVHIKQIAEDPDEGKDWYPPRYVLDHLPNLFDVAKQRSPVYQIAQLAPSFDEWRRLDWASAMDNIMRTRGCGDFDIKPAWMKEFRAEYPFPEGVHYQKTRYLTLTEDSGSGSNKGRDYETVPKKKDYADKGGSLNLE